MPVIGLTGGIATGKSTVGRLLQERGAVLLSADTIAHSLTRPGSGIVDLIADAFGAEFITPEGHLDRRALGDLVFRNDEARRRLEGITHPPILLELHRQIAEAQAADPMRLIVAEVPLLFEAGMEQEFDAILTVVSSRETQLARLASRSGLSEEEAGKRIASQLDLGSKAERSDFVLQNDGELTDLAGEVDRVLPALLAVDKREPITHAG